MADMMPLDSSPHQRKREDVKSDQYIVASDAWTRALLVDGGAPDKLHVRSHVQEPILERIASWLSGLRTFSQIVRKISKRL